MQIHNEASHTCPQCCCSCTTSFFNSPTKTSRNTAPPKLRNSSAAEWRHSFAETTISSIFPNTQFTNHESLPSLHESFNEFTKVFPQYSETEQVDHVRAKDYSHLSLSNQTCLDYIGIGLFSYSQLQQHHHDSSKNQLPSSSSAPQTPQLLPNYSDIPFFSISSKTGSLKTLLLHGVQDSEFEAAMRKRIMSFLNISENDYFMVFTANRTSAFKLVADSYQFQTSKRLLTVYDYESEAVEAMISSSEKRGARAMSAEFSWPRLRIQSTKLRKMIESKRKKKKRKGLFVFPLGSRVTGARYPYLWMSIAQENGWHVLVDACALGPKDMDCFGLSLFQPDFLICSFYKVFGENPSGFGCLFIKKSAISTLESSPSAGIVNLVPEKQPHQLSDDSSSTDIELKHKLPTPTSLHEEKPSPFSSFSGPIQTKQSEIFEDGKPQPPESKLKAPLSSEIEEVQDPVDQTLKKSDVEESVIQCRCLDRVDSLGFVLISNRSRYLINWLVNSMLKLKHPNTQGVSLVKIYGPKVKFDRGPALAFNIFDWKGEKVDPALIQKLADRSNISISFSFLHHIWFADKYAEEKRRVLQTKVVEDQGVVTTNKKKDSVGITVVTAALGFLANFEDVYKLWAFVARFLDADFVEKERWRYTAINQKTIEV